MAEIIAIITTSGDHLNPKEYVIKEKDEYQQLIDNLDDTVWISFNDLMEYTNLGREKLDTLLKRYREELDIMNNGPVKFPDGGKWSFEKEGIRKWLKENHSRVWKDDCYH